jgi:hypothetical protein
MSDVDGADAVAKTNVKQRRLFAGFVIAWVSAGILLAWPSTSSCLNTFIEFGAMTAAGTCLPLSALMLVVWLMIGTVIVLVAHYWFRRGR